MEQNKYEVTTTGNFVKIFINGLLHLSIKKGKTISIQTWIMNDYYFIEYTLEGGETILSEYDEIDKWKSIIELINKHVN